jgi:hypothetical protein
VKVSLIEVADIPQSLPVGKGTLRLVRVMSL